MQAVIAIVTPSAAALAEIIVASLAVNTGTRPIYTGK